MAKADSAAIRQLTKQARNRRVMLVQFISGSLPRPGDTGPLKFDGTKFLPERDDDPRGDRIPDSAEFAAGRG
jgi:hypothetical protein